MINKSLSQFREDLRLLLLQQRRPRRPSLRQPYGQPYGQQPIHPLQPYGQQPINPQQPYGQQPFNLLQPMVRQLFDQQQWTGQPRSADSS